MITFLSIKSTSIRLTAIIGLIAGLWVYGQKESPVYFYPHHNSNHYMFLTQPSLKSINQMYNIINLNPVKDLYQTSLSQKKSLPYTTKKGRSTIRNWIINYGWEILFSGIAIGTGITAGVLHSAAKKQNEEERDLYNKYIDAPPGSDFNKIKKTVYLENTVF